MKNDDVMEIDLFQILGIIKKNLILFLLICIIMAACGYGYSKFFIPEKFTAESKIIIVKDNNSSNGSSVTYSDVQLSQKLTDTYTQIIMSEAISDIVINKLDLKDKYGIGTEEYEKMVECKSVNQTEVMSIAVKTVDPELSASIANEIIRVFISKVYEIMEIQNVSVLNYAKVPTKKSEPSCFKFSAIGGCIGLFICGLICLVKYFTDTKLKTEEEVKAIFDSYPIIGTIPDFEVKEGKCKNKF